jgi:phosphoribosylformylglycinamidine cyclo-ligase
MKYRVNIDAGNETKAGLGKFLDGADPRVLNRVGAFASLFRLDLGRYADPVLVMKTEEPGSKQLLAFQHDRVESICADMINHLINDCIVMGAEPLAVQDLIVCGRLDRAIITRIVAACAGACRAQGCVVTGGETTEQPDVLPPGGYVLGANVIERTAIIDGSRIRSGDRVVALASSGPHTNGYTLIRDLLRQQPALAGEPIGETTFLESVLAPHRCYYQSLKGLFAGQAVAGLAHITGGGIRENLNRILPPDVDARIDLATYRVPRVFSVIARAGSVAEAEMIRTFNLGVGLCVVCRPADLNQVLEHLTAAGEQAYAIGEIVPGSGQVRCDGTVPFVA